MIVRASLVGELVPRTYFCGRMHSVFASACNVALADGRFITLSQEPLPMSAHAIRVAAPVSLRFSDRTRQGDAVMRRAGLLSIGRLVVDLCDAAVWRDDFARLAIGPRSPAVGAAVSTARDALSAVHRSGRDVLTHALDGRIRAFERAVAALNVDAAGAAIAAIVGCGDGLTPAGDDYLGGFAAGLILWRFHRCDRRAFISSLLRRIDRAAASTTDLSGFHLRQATQGRIGQALGELAATLVAGGPARDCHAKVAAAACVGASSGYYAVRGLLAALTLWLQPEANATWCGHWLNLPTPVSLWFRSL